MKESKCKRCGHRIVRHDIIRDKKQKEKGVFCLDCDCNTLKTISEYDRNIPHTRMVNGVEEPIAAP